MSTDARKERQRGGETAEGKSADFIKVLENPSANMKPLANFDDAVKSGDHVTRAEDKLGPAYSPSLLCLRKIKLYINASFLLSQDRRRRCRQSPE